MKKKDCQIPVSTQRSIQLFHMSNTQLKELPLNALLIMSLFPFTQKQPAGGGIYAVRLLILMLKNIFKMAHNGKVTAHCTVDVFLFLIHLAGCHKITLQSVQEMNSVILEQLFTSILCHFTVCVSVCLRPAGSDHPKY